MRSHLARLRGWWVVAALVAAGWGALASGRVLVGGVVMASGCCAALLMRAAGGEDDRLGALILRTRPMDLWLYTTLTANVLGATLLVTRNMDVVALAAVDAALLFVGGWIVFRSVVGRAVSR